MRKGRERQDAHRSKGMRVDFIHPVLTEADLDLITKAPGQMEFSIEGLKRASNLYIIFLERLKM